ncbi:MAG: hypothetical protein WCX71_01415 [Candidatus Buchananbacteria bacterium]
MGKHESFWQTENRAKREISEEIGEGIESRHDDIETDISPEEEKIPIGLERTDIFYANEGEKAAVDVYNWYHSAISRRKREPLEEGRFMYHFFEGGSTEDNYMYGDSKGGYILGLVRHGLFIPTHFAPKSLRGGYDVLKRLGTNADVPAVMGITDDLAATIKKMPEWIDTGMTFPAWFRGQVEQKHLVRNSHPDSEKLLPLLVQDYLDENREDDPQDYDEIGREDDNVSKRTSKRY